MPTLSIIMPVYNTKACLSDSIGSVIRQIYTDWELILVDDGSSDGSSEVCDEFAVADERIRVIHQENRGVAAARNVGIENVRGEYIGFVDSDDLASPAMYQMMISLANQYDADIVQCSHTRTPEAMSDRVDAENISVEVLDRVEGLKRIYRSHYTNSLSLWSKIYRSKIFDGIRFTEGTAFEDDEIVPRLLENSSKTVFCEEPYYCYVKRESSIITAPKIKNIMALTSILENRCIRFQEIDDELYRLSRESFFKYLIQKSHEQIFRDTEVQTQAIALLKKYYRSAQKVCNKYEKISLFLLCKGGKRARGWVIRNEFEPIQHCLEKIKK